MLQYYLLAAFAALALTQFLKSHKAMNLVAIAHAIACIAFAACLQYSGAIPVYYLENNLYIDALSTYEIFIAGTIFLLAAVYAGGHAESLIKIGILERKNLKGYYLSFNALLLFTVLAFSSNNLALFWIFAELTTFFTAFLIAILNSKKNIDASLKYIFVTSTAMLFSFIGLILLFALTEKTLGTGTLNWDVLLKNAKTFPAAPLAASFAFMFLGYAAKSGIAPLHTSLPHAYSKAPSAVSAIISAVMLNIGIYGILRIYSITRQNPGSAATCSNLLIAFGILSLFIAAFSMLQQKNLKKLIAFSSTEHAGLMLIGIGIGTPIAIYWTLYHVLAHSLTKALLFLSAGILNRQYNSNKIENIKNALKLQPLASAGLILGSLAIIGIPPAIVFITKFSILAQVAKFSMILLIAVLLLLLLAAAGFALFITAIFTRIDENDVMRRYPTPVRMKIPVIILIILVYGLGLFFPQPLDGALNSIVSGLGF